MLSSAGRGVLAMAAVLLLAASAAYGQRPNRSCTVPSASGPEVTEAVTPPVALQPEATSASQIINLGAGREPASRIFHVAVQAGDDEPPPDLRRRLVLVADQMLRSGDKTDSVAFPEPTFGEIRPSGNGKRLSFRVCIQPPAELPAGRYVGILTLEGPPGVEPASVTLTVNAKDGTGFRLAAIVAGVLAFFVLLYKGASDERARRLRQLEAAKVPEKIGEEPNQQYVQARRWGSAAGARLSDPGWLGPTIAAIASTFGVLAAAYANNPAWGETGLLASAIALIGTALAAVGAKELFTASGSR